LGESPNKQGEVMEETTTTDSGADSAQPQQDVAVQTEQLDGNEQIITTDENGAPTLAPLSSQPTEPDAPEAVSETKETTETQAPQDDVKEWAEKKGLPLDDPVKLARMYRDAETKMHEATAAARQLETAAQTLDYTGDASTDQLTQTVNQLLIQNNVRDFFSANPEAREFESDMAKLVVDKPYLKDDLQSLYILARNDPNREASLKQQGGKEALQNLAQKQQQIPPSASATNSNAYDTQTITPQNVSELVDRNDQAWFEKNHKAISDALAG
jgi:hypothetical protein